MVNLLEFANIYFRSFDWEVCVSPKNTLRFITCSGWVPQGFITSPSTNYGLGLNLIVVEVQMSSKDVYSKRIKKRDTLCNFDSSNTIIEDLSHPAHCYVSWCRPSAADLKKHSILKSLRMNRDIVIWNLTL